MSVNNLLQAREAVLSLIRTAGRSPDRFDPSGNNSPTGNLGQWRVPGHLVEEMAKAFLTEDTERLHIIRATGNPLTSFVAEQLLNAINDVLRGTPTARSNQSSGDEILLDLDEEKPDNFAD